MAILELRAARGWSLKQTADTFLVTPATIASWMKRIDERGPDALLQLREPVNKFPDFVRYIVQRLKTLSPSMGKVKIAETLCRAGLHLGVTTVGRILREDLQPDPEAVAPSTRVVTAKRPNHVWHVDLTAVPTSVGFWTSWLPFALP
jgi:transcriptional regulator with XRE-family HTH domain